MIFSILHSFVNLFAGGRSDTKVILFILYVIFLTILYFSLKKYTFKALKWKWFGLTLLSLYLYGLVIHIFYFLSNNLVITDFVITGKNGEISSSILWHTHVAKGAIGQIFSFFGETELSTVDAGGAYLGSFSSWVFLFGGILLVACLVQVIVYFVTSVIPMTLDKNKRQKIFYVFGYAVLSFSLIKTGVDGGIFNPSFGIGAIFILLFALRQKGIPIGNYYYYLVGITIVLLSTSLYIDYLLSGNGLSMAALSSLIILYTLILYCTEENIRLQFLLPVIVLFLSSWWIAGARDFDIYNYGRIQISKNQEVFIYKDKEVERYINTEDESIFSLSKKLNKNLSYLPVAVSGVTCMDKSPWQNFSATLISDKQIPSDYFKASSYIKIENNKSVSLGRRWQTVLSARVHPCLPEALSVFDGELKRNNIDDYLLVNPLFYD